MLQVQSSKFGIGVGPNSSFLYRTVSVLLKHITVRAIALMNVKFLSILQKVHIFSILHIHYKTSTLVCLFYYLFYLNNHFPHFFYCSSQLPFNPSENSLSPFLKTLSPPWMKLGHKHHSTNIFSATSTDPQRFIPVDPKTLISSTSTKTRSN